MTLLVPAGRFTCPMPQRRWDKNTFTFLAGSIGVQAQWLPILVPFPFKEPFQGELTEEGALIASGAFTEAFSGELAAVPGLKGLGSCEVFSGALEAEPGLRATAACIDAFSGGLEAEPGLRATGVCVAAPFGEMEAEPGLKGVGTCVDVLSGELEVEPGVKGKLTGDC